MDASAERKLLAVPPGEHLFEFAAAGYVAQEHVVTIHAGVVAELLTVRLKPVEQADAYVKPPIPAEKRRISDRQEIFVADLPPPPKSDPWMVTYVAAGTSIVSLGIGTALGVSASNQVGTLRNTCAPNCGSDQVSSVSTEMTVADVALGVGLVSGTVAVIWAVTHPRTSSPENKSNVGITVHGLAGTF